MVLPYLICLGFVLQSFAKEPACKGQEQKIARVYQHLFQNEIFSQSLVLTNDYEMILAAEKDKNPAAKVELVYVLWNLKIGQLAFQFVLNSKEVYPYVYSYLGGDYTTTTPRSLATLEVAKQACDGQIKLMPTDKHYLWERDYTTLDPIAYLKTMRATILNVEQRMARIKASLDEETARKLGEPVFHLKDLDQAISTIDSGLAELSKKPD